MRRTLQSSLFILLVVISVAGYFNVTSDNADVEKLAVQVACSQAVTGGPLPTPGKNMDCHAQKTSVERNPVAQVFELVTTKGNVTVRCTRSFVFFGEYGCVVR